MKISLFITIVFAVALTASPSFAQMSSASPGAASLPSDSLKAATTTSSSTAPSAGQMSEADMKKMMAQMMELAKPGENHKILAGLAGDWTYNVKMWMNPDAKPETSSGTATRKSVLDGHYFLVEVHGKMQMPGPDGKPKDMDFRGMSIEAYNNVSKKFEATWCDNMGTGIFMSEGDYDAATKTFTYTGEMEVMPGMKTKVRETVKIVDADHHLFEWYEDRGGKEVKTMEIAYTRKK